MQDAWEARFSEIPLDAQSLGTYGCCRSADQCLNLLMEGFQRERLEEIIGCTVLFSGITDMVGLLVESCRHNDRQITGLRQGPKFAAELQAIGPGREKVQ